LLQMGFILAYEPLAQMTVYLVHPFFQFFTWNILLVAMGQFGILDPIKQASSQRLGVGLDHPNETIQHHHDGPPILYLAFSLMPAISASHDARYGCV
jgi:hypothetical protein